MALCQRAAGAGRCPSLPWSGGDCPHRGRAGLWRQGGAIGALCGVVDGAVAAAAAAGGACSLEHREPVALAAGRQLRRRRIQNPQGLCAREPLADPSYRARHPAGSPGQAIDPTQNEPRTDEQAFLQRAFCSYAIALRLMGWAFVVLTLASMAWVMI